MKIVIDTRKLRVVAVLFLLLAIVGSFLAYIWFVQSYLPQAPSPARPLFLPLTEPKISIEHVAFILRRDGRYLEVKAKAVGNFPVDLAELYINASKILTWFPEKPRIEPGETISILVDYPWLPGKTYEIKVVSTLKTYADMFVHAPHFSYSIEVNVTGIQVESQSDLSRLHVDYYMNATGVEFVNVIAFLFESYTHIERPIFIFYDSKYQSASTLQKADAFFDLASEMGFSVNKVDWEGLKELVMFKPPCILIMTNPMKTSDNVTYYNAVPSCLVDPDEDAYVREHSIHDKSIIYDWETDCGLVYITMSTLRTIREGVPDETLEPTLKAHGYSNNWSHEWIMAENGTVYALKDSYVGDLYTGSFMPFDAIGVGRMLPLTRIAQSLCLYAWSSWWHLNSTGLALSNQPFYVYCEGYDTKLDLANPVFIKVNKGGWLFCGDASEMNAEELAWDLVMMILHAPWDGVWLKQGWYYDNGYEFHTTKGGAYSTEGTIVTGWSETLNIERLLIRLLALGYDRDNNRYIVRDEAFEFS